MNILNYIIRSLRYYKKQHLAILFGTIISTAVLTGALIVGDSVKYSLQELTDQRLGKTEYALILRDRFITEDLVTKMDNLDELSATGILALKGMAIENVSGNWVPETDVIGIDSSFWNFSFGASFKLKRNEVLVNIHLAERLQLTKGDEILLRIENVDAIPVNSPFTQEKEASVAFRVKIADLIEDQDFGRFSLLSSQKAPYNLFIPREVLQDKLNLNGKVNTVLAHASASVIPEADMDAYLKQSWTIKDAGLILKNNPFYSYPELTSERVFIDEEIARKISSSFAVDPVLTYLVNDIRFKNKSTPYSFVSGIYTNALERPLESNEIILNDWCAADLGVQIGDTIGLEYFVIGSLNILESKSEKFRVSGIEQNQSDLFNKEMMPDFPGLADAKSCSDWDTGIPIDLDRIRDKDEEFWNEFKGTPKGIISLEAAQKLWTNNYGSLTTVFFPGFQDTELLRKKLDQKILPGDIGLEFRDVKEAGQLAVSNSVDFGQLFLSMSFFVLLAGVLLLVLLYGLNLLNRIKEVNILSSLGIRKKRIFRIFLGESTITILFGSMLGALLGIAYNYFLMAGLSSIWQGAVRTKDLSIFVDPFTVFLGFGLGVIIAFLTVFLLLRKVLTKGLSVESLPRIKRKKKYFNSRNIAFVVFILLLCLLLYALYSGQLHNKGIFMASGSLLLVLSILLLNTQLLRVGAKKTDGVPGIRDLVIKNLARNKSRTLLAISMLAVGLFSVLITGANRQSFAGTENNNKSGTGGFSYWIETSLPLLYDPSTDRGRDFYNLEGESMVDSIVFVPLLTLKGEDASCLNLNQVQNPQILGVDPYLFDNRKAFSFGKIMDFVNRDNPWLDLNKDLGEGVIAAYIDQTVITWGLMKEVGDTLIYRDDFGNDLKILIAGGLNNSIFQGNVMVSQSNLLKHFPSAAAAHVLLLDVGKLDKSRVESMINFSFRDYGLDYMKTPERMQEFNSVSNTYLTVFMMLGGLGLLIGTIGFGIILLRNRQERKKEFALLSAIGIKNKSLFKLLFLEHLVLLSLGIGMGTLAAIIGMLPSLATDLFSVPFVFVGIILSSIFLSGLFWIYVFARNSADQNLLDDLRKE